MNHALATAAALVMLAGAAAAQPRTVRVQPDEPARHGERQVREHSREGDRDVQRNRQRLTREAPDAGQSDDAEPRPDADKPERRPPFQAHANALRALNRAADAALHLTDEQSEQVRAVMQAHRAARQEFMKEHAEEIQQLREQARRERAAMPASERDGDADATDTPRQPLTRSRTDRDTREAREAEIDDAPRARRSGRSPAADKLRAMLESAPFEAEMTKRLLRILTEEQRAHVQQTLTPRRPADAGPDRPARERRGVEIPGHGTEQTEPSQGVEDVHIEVRWDD